MNIAKALSALAAVTWFVSLHARAQETLRFTPTADPNTGIINYSWFSSDNWYRFDTPSGKYVKAGKLPTDQDTADVTGIANAVANVIPLKSLAPNVASTINGGNFIVQTLLVTSAIAPSFHGSSIEASSSITLADLSGLQLDNTLVKIDLGAYAIIGNGSTLGLSSNATVFNQGQVVLAGGSPLPTTFITTVSGAFTGFSNRPNAILSSSGTTVVGGGAGGTLGAPLVFDNAGLIRADSGTLRLTSGIIWSSSNSNGLSRFKAAVTNATIAFDGPTVPGDLTFAFSGPGTNVFTGAGTVNGALQVGIVDSATGVLDMGTLNIGGGLSGTGMVHVVASTGFPSTLKWSGGTISLQRINIDSGGRFNIGGDPYLSGTVVSNFGTTTMSGSGSFGMSTNASFNNEPGAVFDAQNNQPISGDIYGIVAANFNNAGTFKKSAGSNDTAFSDAFGPGPNFNNSGLLDVESGGVVLLSGTNSGEFHVAAGTHLTFSNRTNTMAPGARFSGPGLVTVGGGSPVLKLNTNVSIDNFALGLGGVLDGPSDLTVNSGFTWNGGALQGGGVLNLGNNAIVTLINGTQSQRPVNNSGRVNWNGGGIFARGGAVFNNLATGLFVINPSGSAAFDWDGTGTAPVFNNFGTVSNASPSFPVINWAFTNSGSVLLGTNRMHFKRGYTQLAGQTVIGAGATLQSDGPSSAPTVVILGGILSGSGSVAGGALTNSGTVHPGSSPGILTVSGGFPVAYGQGPTGTLAVEIGGRTAGTQYSQLAVNGAAALGGTLSVSFINAFVPSPADTFAILTFTSSTGKFAAVNGVHTGGMVLVPRYSATNVTLVAAVDPQYSALTYTNNHFSFSFSTTIGFSYLVESTDSLDPPISWQTVTNVPGNGGTVTIVDPAPAGQRRFYGILIQ